MHTPRLRASFVLLVLCFLCVGSVRPPTVLAQDQGATPSRQTALLSSLTDQEEGLTPDQAIQLEEVGSVAVSPDGVEIAYTLVVPADPREKNALPASELHVWNVAEERSRPFVTGDVRVQDVQWTPSGEAITFLTRREGDAHTALYRIPRDGGEARRLFRFETAISGYDWAPDGEQIVFTAPEPQENSSPLPYTPNVYRDAPRHTRAYVAELDPGADGEDGPANTDAPEPRRLRVEGTIHQVQWSPEGAHIAVSRTPTPYVDDSYVRRTIRIVSASDLEVVSTIENPGKLGEIAWSPDGERIAFVGGADAHDTIDGRLMVAEASSDAYTQILEGYEGKIDDVAWTGPETIRFSASRGVWTVLSRVHYDGSGHEVLVESGGPIVNGFATTDEGARTAIVADSPRHPRELYLMEGSGGRLARLTHHNPVLEEVRLGEQEVVAYEARDGLEIQGVLVRPLGGSAQAPHPTILVVHGGPESHHDMGWLTDYADLGQVAAARGFALFYPNYRGSTGRGLAFATSSQGDPAGAEFEDLVDGVDYLVEEGITDPEAVGVTGGSYGGYATAWMATRYTDRFAAGVMFVGISDVISAWGSSDIPQELYQVHYLEHMWEDWNFYLERSPIYHTDGADTPLLIMEGAEDSRLYPSQSIEMYNFLEFRSDAPVRLVTYPGEGHGNRRATAEYDYMLRSLRWMEHYLQGPGGEKPDPSLGR